MPNTFLFYDNNLRRYEYYRPWDSGQGFMHGGHPNIDSLIQEMIDAQDLWKKPFDPIADVPKIDFGYRDTSSIKAMEEKDVRKVREALQGKLK